MKRILPEENMSWQRPVLSISNNGTATKGFRYIVGEAPTGEFSGFTTDNIAWYDGDEWQQDTPEEGWVVYDLNQSTLLVFMNGPSGDYWYYFSDIFGSAGGGSGTDANAIHDNVAGEINAITEKASPVSADLIIIEDSEDSNNKKKVQLTNLPAAGGLTTRWIWVGAEEIHVRGSGAALNAVGANTRYLAWAMSGTADEGLVTDIMVPADWVSGALTFKLYWTNGGAGSGNVVFRNIIKEIEDTANLDDPTGEISTIESAIAAPTLNILKVSTLSLSYTPSAAGAHARWLIIRLASSSGSDTLTNDIWLLGARIEYTSSL